MKQRTLLFFLLFITFAAGAQEIISPLSANYVLMEQYAKKQKPGTARMASAAALTLPFIDDFSKPGPWPDTAKWVDDNVFINTGFAKAPPTIGVATFDGLMSNGLPYDWNVQNNSSKPADTLTSQPVNLAGFTLVDSIYFSFFYQAQGRGNAPEPGDSLVLEFKEANDTVWTRMWSVAGYTLAANDSTFNFVVLQVPFAYMYGTFQFRFWNKATLSGNVDHWNIDYVYLDKNRNNPSRNFPDVALVYPTPSLLKNYRAMPWNQFVPSEMATSIYHPVRNNYTTDLTTDNYLKVRDESGAYVYNPGTISSGNLSPYDVSGYSICSNGCPGMRTIPLSYTFTVTDSTYFDVIDSIHVTGTDLVQTNNVYTTRQVFGNYFAYDDGSAELAYGLSSAFAQLAYKFTLNVPDTLRALSIYWNPFLTNVQAHGIRITVWGDNNGVPGAIKYQSVVQYPQYQPGYNGFTYYPITDTILPLSGIIYVGFVQIDPETLNVGLDMNSNAQSKIFYNTQGNWNNTIYKGALMMRPYFGPESLLAEVPEVHHPGSLYSIYPNPAQERVYVKGRANTGNDRLQLMVFDAYGRIVSQLQQYDDNSVDVSSLAAGVYFIRIVNADGNVSTERFIIAR